MNFVEITKNPKLIFVTFSILLKDYHKLMNYTKKPVVILCRLTLNLDKYIVLYTKYIYWYHIISYNIGSYFQYNTPIILLK